MCAIASARSGFSRQRNPLSSTSLTACLAATGEIPKWDWQLWPVPAAGLPGIFVVHARLDVVAASKKGVIPPPENRRAAFACQILSTGGAVGLAWQRNLWITAALLPAATGYVADLRRQENPAALQMPLKQVGLQALALSIAYTLAVVIGLCLNGRALTAATAPAGCR